MSGQVRCVRWNPSGTIAAAVAVGEKGPLIITDHHHHHSSDQTPPYILSLPSKG